MKMEKKCYCAPRAKFHKLSFNASMLNNGSVIGEDDRLVFSKAATIYFDEDED